MTLKNRTILKRTISMLIPMCLVVGVSCFFFINIDWSKYTVEMWRQMIMTWIISYGGIILLFVKAILTIISAKKILSKKPNVTNEKGVIGVNVFKNKKLLAKSTKNKSKDQGSTNEPTKFSGYR